MENVKQSYESSFKPISIKDFIAKTPKEIVWLWDSIIPEGILFLIAAHPKTGKSSLLSQLAVAVAKGEEFLGRKTKQTGVLILALEEPAQSVRERFEILGVNETDPIFLHDMNNGSLSHSPETIRDLRQCIVTNGIGLVIIDTVGHFWNLESENSNAEVLRAIKPLVSLAHETNCSIGLVHHTNKQGDAEFRNIRGASSIFGSVDQALLLEQTRGGGDSQRALKVDGRYNFYSPDKMIINFVNRKYEYLGTKKEIKQEELRESVLALISEFHGITIKEIADKLDLSRTPVRKVLKELEDEHKAKTHGTGKKRDPIKYYVA